MRCENCGDKLVKTNNELISYKCKSCGHIIDGNNADRILKKSKGNKILGFIFIIIGIFITLDNFKEQIISRVLDLPLEILFSGSLGTVLIIIGVFCIMGKINLIKHVLYSYYIRTNSKFQR